MAITVIEHKLLSPGEYHVVLGADKREELTGPEASRIATRVASEAGIANAALLHPSTSPYPVDNKGVADAAVALGQSPVAGYRRDFVLRRGI